MKYGLLIVVVGATLGAFSEPNASRESFLKQQAVAEMHRVVAQVDVLAANQEELSGRVAKAESVKSDIASLKAEIDALKSSVAELRSELEAQRTEIIRELSKKIAALPPPKSSASATASVSDEDCYDYVVQPKDSLYLIAKALGTTVTKIKALNGMKSDRISVGQKIKVPRSK